MPLGVRLAGIVLAGGTLLSAAACGFQNADAAVVSSPLDALPKGPCAPGPLSDSLEALRAAAEKCLPAMEAGSVAVVSFNLSPAETQQVADGITAATEKASDGKVNLSATTFQATASAKKQLEKQLKGADCIDETKPEQLAAAAADLTMPELLKSDFVVAVSDLPSCHNAGAVEDGLYGRRADIFKDPRGARPAEQKRKIASGAHELMHLLRWGHGGVFTGADENGHMRTLNEQGVVSGADIDLDAYMRTGSYSEYGNWVNGDLMGSLFDPEKIAPNPVEVAALDWPNVVLDGEQASPAKSVRSDKWVTLDKNDAIAGNFASLKLNKPYPLIDIQTAAAAMSRGMRPDPRNFNHVNVVPAKDGVDGFTVVLSDDQNYTANLGDIVYDGKPGVTTLKVGDRTLEVHMNGRGIKVRVIGY